MSKYVLLCLLVCVVGCQGSSGPRTVDASGVVTLDGAPVEKAQVVFIDNNAANPASGMTDSQGHFSLSLNGEKKGAIPGSYKVQVSKTQLKSAGGGGAEVTITYGLPKKYANIVTSGMTFDVPENGSNAIKLELSSK